MKLKINIAGFLALFLCVFYVAICVAQEDQFLETCLKVAEARDKKLIVSREQIALSKTRVTRSFRNFFPYLLLQRTSQKGKTLATAGGSAYESEQIGAKLTQPIYAGGSILATYRYDKFLSEAAKLNYTKNREDLFYKIKTSYFELLASREESQRLNEASEQITALYNKVQSEYKAKAISELDMLEAQVFADKVKMMKESSEMNYDLAKNKLLALSNLTSLEELIYALPEKIETPKAISFTFDECVGFLKTNCVELKSAQTSINLYQQKKKIDTAKVVPNFSVDAFYGQSGEAYVTEPLELADVWNVMGKVNWLIGGNTLEVSQTENRTNPSDVTSYDTRYEDSTFDMKLSILDNLNYFVESKESTVNFNQANADYEMTVKEATLNLQKFFNEYQQSLLNARANDQDVELKSRKLAVLKKRNDFYEVSTLEVMDGVFKYSDAVVAYAKSLAQNYTAVTEMERLVLVPLRYK